MTALPIARSLRRLVALTAGVIALLLGVAPPAQAHPTLLFTTPAADTAVAEAPTVSQRNRRSSDDGGRGGQCVRGCVRGGAACALPTPEFASVSWCRVRPQ